MLEKCTFKKKKSVITLQIWWIQLHAHLYLTFHDKHSQCCLAIRICNHIRHMIEFDKIYDRKYQISHPDPTVLLCYSYKICILWKSYWYLFCQILIIIWVLRLYSYIYGYHYDPMIITFTYAKCLLWGEHLFNHVHDK